MGSYNVACSISSISIGPGDRIAFFPLLPNSAPWGYGPRMDKSSGLASRITRESIHRVGIQSSLIYTNCYFNPLCLPVFGEYNDYGGVENIEEDSNTKALEEFLGMPVGDIIDCITCLREPTESYSSIYRLMAMHKDRDFILDPELMEKVGFTKEDDLLFSLKDWKVRLFEHENDTKFYASSKFGFELMTSDGEILQTYGLAHRTYEELYFAVLKNFKYYINYPDDKQKAVHLLSNLSGMFVLRDIYEGMSNYPGEAAHYGYERTVADGYLQPSILQEFGFEIIKQGDGKEWDTVWSNKNYPRYQLLARDAKDICLQIKDTETNKTEHHYARLRGLKKHWKDKTGEDLDISKYEDMSMHASQYDSYRASIIAFDEKMKAEEDSDNKDLESALRVARLMSWEDPHSSSIASPGGFYFGYKDWKFFREIYKNAIKEDYPGLKEAFDVYHHFDLSLIGANRFYFSAVNGEQCGNPRMSKHLLSLSMKIVDDKIREMDSY